MKMEDEYKRKNLNDFVADFNKQFKRKPNKKEMKAWREKLRMKTLDSFIQELDNSLGHHA